MELIEWFYLEYSTYGCRGYLKLATWMDREASGPRGRVTISALENTSLLCARRTSRLWETEGVTDTQPWVRGLFNFFFKIYLFLYVYECFVYIPGACGSQKRALGTLKQGL